MKKLIFSLVMITASIFSSCSKDEQSVQKADVHVSTDKLIASEFNEANSTRISWDNLPAELKNATPLESAVQGNASAAAKVLSNESQGTYGPWGGLSGSTFSITPPAAPDGCRIYAMALNSNSGFYIDKLVVWYVTSSGAYYKYERGSATSFFLHYFASDEYINKVAGRSDVFVNQLSISTNKKRFTYGGNGGTAFSQVVPVGFQILAFRGRSGTYVNQIGFGYYCKTWKLLSGSDARDIAVDGNGATYLTNSVGKIYKYVGSSWVQLQGSDAVRVTANANRVCMVNTAGKMYELFGNNWVPLPGSDARDMAITSDGKLWMVNSAGIIYRYTQTGWNVMPGGNATRIAAGGDQVWMVSATRRIYKWNGTSWTMMPGTDARDIAVGNDGSVLITNTAGEIYTWNGMNWLELCGSDGVSIAVNHDQIMMVNTAGKIYQLVY